MVTQGDVSLVVLTARRLGCLYDVLVDAGMPRITGADVVTQRYLDIAPNRPGPDEGVVVLDDSVVVGTTLFEVHRLLSEERGAADVRARTVCVDKGQHAPFLIEKIRLEGASVRPTEEVEQFSRDIVTTLYRRGIPYFSDFPVVRTLTINQDQWDAALHDSRWHVADVTAPLIADDDQQSYTFIPTEPFKTELTAGMPRLVADLVAHVKFRTFVRPAGNNVHVTVVPLALLRPCSFSSRVRLLPEASLPDDLSDLLEAGCRRVR